MHTRLPNPEKPRIHTLVLDTGEETPAAALACFVDTCTALPLLRRA